MRKYFILLPLFLFLFLSFFSLKVNAECSPVDIPKIPVTISPTQGGVGTSFKVTIQWGKSSMSDKDFEAYQDIDIHLNLFNGNTPVLASEMVNDSLGRPRADVSYILGGILLPAGTYNLKLHLFPRSGGPTNCVVEQGDVGITLVSTLDPGVLANPGTATQSVALAGGPCDETQQDNPLFKCPYGLACMSLAADNEGSTCMVDPSLSSYIRSLPPCAQWITATGSGITPDTAATDVKNNVPIKCSTIDTAIGIVKTDPTSFVISIFNIVLGIAGGIALILIILAGYRYMTSQGNPEAVKAANEQLTAAIVGLLFIIFSFVILRTIGVDILQIPGFPTFSSGSGSSTTPGGSSGSSPACTSFAGASCMPNNYCILKSGYMELSSASCPSSSDVCCSPRNCSSYTGASCMPHNYCILKSGYVESSSASCPSSSDVCCGTAASGF